MSRGISTIIAAILLLIITIGLASSAYLFITRLLYAQTSKTIQLLDASCTGGNITLVVSNQGTDIIADTDLKVHINNEDKSTFFTTGTTKLTPLDPQDTEVDTYKPEDESGDPPYSGSVRIRVTSPSNSIETTIWC